MPISNETFYPDIAANYLFAAGLCIHSLADDFMLPTKTTVDTFKQVDVYGGHKEYSLHQGSCLFFVLKTRMTITETHFQNYVTWGRVSAAYSQLLYCFMDTWRFDENSIQVLVETDMKMRMSPSATIRGFPAGFVCFRQWRQYKHLPLQRDQRNQTDMKNTVPSLIWRWRKSRSSGFNQGIRIGVEGDSWPVPVIPPAYTAAGKARDQWPAYITNESILHHGHADHIRQHQCHCSCIAGWQSADSRRHQQYDHQTGKGPSCSRKLRIRKPIDHFVASPV